MTSMTTSGWCADWSKPRHDLCKHVYGNLNGPQHTCQCVCHQKENDDAS
jgi:hypothetical protein